MHVVVCTYLSGNEPVIQVGVGNMVTSRNLGGVMVSRCVFDPRSRHNISHFHHAHDICVLVRDGGDE